MQVLVLGIGNELLGDEGVGVHAARHLRQLDLPPEITVVEVGTAILDVLPFLETADYVIVLDAMQSDGVPGTVYRIPLDDCSGSACIASMHGFDIFRVMALAERKDVPSVTVFGMEPGSLTWSLELSPEIEEALPVLLSAVKQELTDKIEKKEDV